MSTQAMMTALTSLSETAAGPFEIADLLRKLTELAAQHLVVDGAGVMLADGAKLEFLHSNVGNSAHMRRVQTVERLQELTQVGPCRDAFNAQREVVVDDLEDCAGAGWGVYLQGAHAVGLRSVVAMPLISRGKGWGVLDLYRRHPGAWSEQDLAAVRLLAAVAVSYLVMAVDRDDARRTHTELAHSNLHDHLTGLPNRALLFDRLNHALSRARRHQLTVAAFFIDLDQFKRINDTYGHGTGDDVLIEVTRRMTATLRAEDTLGRLSGDEFVLICEDLPQHSDGELDVQVATVNERLHRALAEPISFSGMSLQTSASIGVALSTDDSTADDLLADADAAMYRTKQRRHTGSHMPIHSVNTHHPIPAWTGNLFKRFTMDNFACTINRSCPSKIKAFLP